MRPCQERSLTRRQLLKRGSEAAFLGAISGFPTYLGCQKQAQQGPPVHPTIILITLDTTRADHLGCYGYRQPTSPNIDRFANESLVYDRAIAPGTWTLPSHASLLTGKFAASHGAQYDANGSLRLADAISGHWDHFRIRTLGPAETTLANVLKAAGYLTGAVVAGPWMKKVFGLSKGFDHYDDDNISTVNGRLAEDVTDRALEWLGETPNEPRLLFLNYFDPHVPLTPPNAFAEKFRAGTPPENGKPFKSRRQQIRLYNAEILYMDHHVGRLFNGLKDRGLYDNAWIIVTADHGDLFGEHNQDGHGATPYQEVAHIPMILKDPAGRNRSRRRTRRGRVEHWIQLQDLFAMILDRLGLEIPASTQCSLPPDIEHPILIESRTLESYTPTGDWLSIIEGDLKYVWNSKGSNMLFDLKRDPRENRNLISAQPDFAKTMREKMRDYLASLPRPGAQNGSQQVDQQTIDALKGVGYLK